VLQVDQNSLSLQGLALPLGLIEFPRQFLNPPLALGPAGGKVAQGQVRQPAVVVGQHIVGFQVDGLAETGDCLAQPAEEEPVQAELEAQVRAVGRHLDALLE
jgi:hypothetical protein